MSRTSGPGTKIIEQGIGISRSLHKVCSGVTGTCSQRLNTRGAEFRYEASMITLWRSARLLRFRILYQPAFQHYSPSGPQYGSDVD